MRRSLVVLIVAMVLAGGVGLSAAEKKAPRGHDKSITREQALDIAEATFRYQFGHNASGQQRKAPAYFLSLFGKDPDDAFLKRFEGHTPPVKKGSAFKIGKGLLFRVVRISRASDVMVEVSGGYYEAGLSSSGNTYVAELKDGKWVVTGSTMHWIS